MDAAEEDEQDCGGEEEAGDEALEAGGICEAGEEEGSDECADVVDGAGVDAGFGVEACVDGEAGDPTEDGVEDHEAEEDGGP